MKTLSACTQEFWKTSLVLCIFPMRSALWSLKMDVNLATQTFHMLTHTVSVPLSKARDRDSWMRFIHWCTIQHTQFQGLGPLLPSSPVLDPVRPPFGWLKMRWFLPEEWSETSSYVRDFTVISLWAALSTHQRLNNRYVVSCQCCKNKLHTLLFSWWGEVTHTCNCAETVTHGWLQSRGTSHFDTLLAALSDVFFCIFMWTKIFFYSCTCGLGQRIWLNCWWIFEKCFSLQIGLDAKCAQFVFFSFLSYFGSA